MQEAARFFVIGVAVVVAMCVLVESPKHLRACWKLCLWFWRSL